MVFMKKVLSVFLLATVILSASVLALASSRNQSRIDVYEDEFGGRAIVEYGIPTEKALEQLAAIERIMMDTDYHSRVEGNKIIIDMREVDALVRKNELSQNVKTRNDAIDFLVMNTLLFHEAQQRGLLADENEIWTMIQEQKNMDFSEASREEFEKYAGRLGMTANELWDAQYDAYFLHRTLVNFWDDVLTQRFGEGTQFIADTQYLDEGAKRLQAEVDIFTKEYYENLKAKYVIVYE